PLLGQRPAPQDRGGGHDERKPMFGRERDTCVCPLEGQLSFTAVYMKPRRKVQGTAQAIRVRQLSGERERLTASLDGLVRIAKKPQDMGNKAPAKDPRVRRREPQRAVLLGVVEDNPMLQVRSGG